VLITVTLMLPVPTLLVASPVPVARDTLEMGSCVQVNGLVCQHPNSQVQGCTQVYALQCCQNIFLLASTHWVGVGVGVGGGVGGGSGRGGGWGRSGRGGEEGSSGRSLSPCLEKYYRQSHFC
jgi:hypothetical protein